MDTQENIEETDQERIDEIMNYIAQAERLIHVDWYQRLCNAVYRAQNYSRGTELYGHKSYLGNYERANQVYVRR